LKGWRERREYGQKEKLEVAIYCLHVRMFQLANALEDCLLCKMFFCEECPGSEADYSCGNYFEDVAKIVEKLKGQVRKWIEEVGKG